MFPSPVRARLLAAMLASATPVFAGAGPAAPPSAEPAIEALARQFDLHPLLLFGEVHRSATQHAFFAELMRDPRFICRVDDIVVEFGNARLQPVVDAYVAGEDVDDAGLQAAWRETAVPFAWNSPVYAAFYAAARDVNLFHRCAHPVRVVLGDPPLDWSTIDSAQALSAYADRDAAFVAAVEREVLAKRRTAWLVAGQLHAVRALPASEGNGPDATVAQLIERRHPGLLACVSPVPSRAAAVRLGLGEAPAFADVHAGPGRLSRANFGLIAPGWKVQLVQRDGRPAWDVQAAPDWPTIGDVTDALLYLGDDAAYAFPSPTVYLEPHYQQELRRRIGIIRAWNGQDFGPVLDDLLRTARDGAPDS
ncbi:hypothetical protein [Dokdonella sp.]|uniref:hypothetical protein n=1 Tax=Dokdonella sp. TaxID=2291710 RepID=UPI002F3FB1BF